MYPETISVKDIFINFDKALDKLKSLTRFLKIDSSEIAIVPIPGNGNFFDLNGITYYLTRFRYMSYLEKEPGVFGLGNTEKEALSNLMEVQS